MLLLVCSGQEKHKKKKISPETDSAIIEKLRLAPKQLIRFFFFFLREKFRFMFISVAGGLCARIWIVLMSV